MKSVIRFYVVASALTLGVGLSPAWALTEADARIQLDQHATDAQLNSKDRAAAVDVLNILVQEGVPVKRAYELVETAIDKGVTGPELGDIAKDIKDRRDEGATAEAVAAEFVSSLEQRETIHGDEMRDHARGFTSDHRDLHKTMDMSGANSGSGIGSGFGAGGMDMSGASSGSGVGSGAGAGAGSSSDFGSGGR